MVIKKEVVELSDGTKIEVKQLSFAAQLRLAKNKETPAVDDYLQECLSVDDYKKLDEINAKEGLKLKEALVRVNEWNIPEQSFEEKKE